MRDEIMVTGATGFVGKHLLRTLKRQGRHVTAISRQPAESLPPHIVSEANRWIRPCDLEDFDLGSFTCIVHLSTNYGIDGNFADVVASNVVWPLSLLANARRDGVPLFIAADSFFGKKQFDYPHMRAYTLSKRQFVEWGKLQAPEDSLHFCNARFEHIYGSDDRDGKFVPALLAGLKSGTTTFPCTTATQKRDFVYVDDAVSALLTLVDQGAQLPTFTEVEIGTGRSIPVFAFMEELKRQLSSLTEFAYGKYPTRPGEIMDSCANPSVLVGLGWQAKYDYVSGIAALLSAERSLE